MFRPQGFLHNELEIFFLRCYKHKAHVFHRVGCMSVPDCLSSI